MSRSEKKAAACCCERNHSVHEASWFRRLVGNESGADARQHLMRARETGQRKNNANNGKNNGLQWKEQCDEQWKQ
ncbi:MAG TPA: hypothetical protein VKX28_01035 [Xanthobacteraceae bacterium]|nr:hypothetical protein [Xanthobacteraceae bacterium]